MTAAVPNNAMSLETKQAPWWLGMLGGVLNIILGIMLLTSPVRTTLAFVWVLGIFWVVEGIFTLVHMFVDRTAWGWKLFSGLLSIIVGMIVVRNPIMAGMVIPMTLVLMLGIQGIIVGVIALVMAFRGGGVFSAIMGLLSIIFGVILVLNFASIGTVAAFIWVVGVLFIVGGIAGIFQAWRNKTD